ncbi:MAG: murein transglycosylase A [Rhodocyclaceae bacterium]|nr:murein transglycosylase A [Rhodocyclaceae bacterium]
MFLSLSSSISCRAIAALTPIFLLAACSQAPVQPSTSDGPLLSMPAATCAAPVATCPACPVCPVVKPPKPDAKPLLAAQWSDLPGWNDDDPSAAFVAFLTSCAALEKKPLWQTLCRDARGVVDKNPASLRAWFESNTRPWALVNPDGGKTGLITGYYEPVLTGSRTRSKTAGIPVFGPPDDMITVELSDLYPELKHMRLRGRIEGRKLIPYYSRSDWAAQEAKRASDAILFVDDAIDFFFMQIQGSGQVQFADGSRVRLNYADQNGHPYKSIGRWLIDKGELKSHEASMQGIKAWAKANPKRLAELLNANPSLVFFRELALTSDSPPGAMGLPLTAERSIAVDPRHVSLGAPVWLATTRPNSDQVMNKLMLAQDTGGAIRGVVRADFFWGSGTEAGAQAGKMKQSGQMWILFPRDHIPENSEGGVK